MNRPVILTFARFYLPGFKSGGPVRTLASIIEQLGDELDFRVVTSDRDARNVRPYSGVEPDNWTNVGKTQVFYASPRTLAQTGFVRSVLQDIPHDAIYLNSYFDFRFSVQVMLAVRYGQKSSAPVLLAPRGELSSGALGLKRWKKIPFLAISQLLGLHSGLLWQASSEHEKLDIVRHMAFSEPEIVVAPNLPGTAQPSRRIGSLRREPADSLRVVFLSRITPIKNLDFAIETLMRVRSTVSFDIFGPITDGRYWKRCQSTARQLPANIRMSYRGVVQPADILQTFSQYDLLFLPTRSENFGHVIVESLRAGTPVLISDKTPWQRLQERGFGWDLSLNDADRFVEVIESAAASIRVGSAHSRQRISEMTQRHLLNNEALQRNRDAWTLLLQRHNSRPETDARPEGSYSNEKDFPFNSTPSIKRRRVVLTFVRFYLPGFKSGGPARTIANLVKAIGDEVDFKIITSDRDSQDEQPYPDIRHGQWQRVEGAEVFYVSPDALKPDFLHSLIRSTPHDSIYLNSFFDPRFSLSVLLGMTLGRTPRSDVILAPRGEFSSGALQLKRWKKVSFLLLFRWAGLQRNILWQASSSYEAMDIGRNLGVPAEQIIVAPNPTKPTATIEHMAKRVRAPGEPLRVIFLSRITPKKNLDYVFRVLARVKVPLVLDIYGPIGDKAYWQRCQRLKDQLPDAVKMSYRGPIPPERVPSTFSKYDLFFLPTRGENYGHVIAESLAVGTPVLLSDQTPWRNLSERGLGWDIPLADFDIFVQIINCVGGIDKSDNPLPSRLTVARNASQLLLRPSVIQKNRELFLKRARLPVH